MAYVTVINEHQHVQQVVSGHHHLTADEAVAAGGSDAGFAPRELLLASLGTCTAVALRKHAAQNDWTLGKITVGVRWSRGALPMVRNVPPGPKRSHCTTVTGVSSRPLVASIRVS